MWFLAITSCLCFAATTVLAAPRGLTACPQYWIPDGEDVNGCPLRCLNPVTGEKIHLIVRYTLKGALLKGCVQCEERWIENTDCVMVLCPGESPPCAASDVDAKSANASTQQPLPRRYSSEQTRQMSLELFKKLYPREIPTQSVPGGGFMRLYMPTQERYIPRYTKSTVQSGAGLTTNTSTEPPRSDVQGSHASQMSHVKVRGSTSTPIAELDFARTNHTTSDPREAISKAADTPDSLNSVGNVATNRTSDEPSPVSYENVANSPQGSFPTSKAGAGGSSARQVETSDASIEAAIPPPAPAPRVKSRYLERDPPHQSQPQRTV